jgi:hypothetical protein
MADKKQLSQEEIQALIEKNKELEAQLEKANKQKGDKPSFTVAKGAKIGYSIEVESLEPDKHHKTGDKFHVGEANAIRLAERKAVKILGKFQDPDMEAKAKKAGVISILLLFVAFLLGGTAPVMAQKSMWNTPTYSLENLRAATLTVDTVTNGGTSFLTSKKTWGNGNVTITVNVTKISGTVGGTITLQGSDTGETANFKALNTLETQTGLATVTATDATNAYSWRLNGNPYQYYRVSWTGTGTMSASFSATYKVRR